MSHDIQVVPVVVHGSELKSIDRLPTRGLHVRKRGGPILKVILLHVPLVVCVKLVHDQKAIAVLQASSSCYLGFVGCSSARHGRASS